MVPSLSLMRISQIVALGSVSVSLKYIRPSPRMPFFWQNECELGMVMNLEIDTSNKDSAYYGLKPSIK